MALAIIPWVFSESAMGRIWVWSTPHFHVKITGEMHTNSVIWELGDLVISNQGAPRYLTDGRSADFAAAEREVREAVGKCYPPSYGYRPYAGALATTFQIATGEQVDFGGFEGMRSIVTVRMPNGLSKSYVGSIKVVHYEIELTPDTGNPLRITPQHIVKIVGEGGARGAARSADYLGSGRMYRGVVTPGCNGKPGFLPQTVDHAGDPCPTHEDSGKHQFASLAR